MRKSFLAAVLSAAIIAIGAGAQAARAASAPQEGMPAPAFSLQSLDSKAWSLAQTRGRIVVINFFATWCPPCRAETPDLIAAEKKYASRGVIFIGVDDEESAALVSVFTKAKGIRYPIVLDEHGAVERNYDVRAIPTTYVLDRKGIIRYRQVDQLDVKVLDQALAAVVAGTPLPQTSAAKKFNEIATNATATIAQLVGQAKTGSGQSAQGVPDPKALDTAIKTGVDANKQIDDLLSSPDASSINYFEQMQIRGKLNAQLADAYELRAGLAGASSATSDQEQAALLRAQIDMDNEQFSDAASLYAVAMQLAPKDTQAYDGAYLAAYELRDYAKAAAFAKAEADIAPTDPESWLTVSSANNALKNYDAALEAQRKALALASDAYARNPKSKSAAYELGRVWLKMARTDLLAGNSAAAAALLQQASAAAPSTIVAQQADEQFAALEPAQIAIDRLGSANANGKTTSPAHVYVMVRNPSQQTRSINLKASGLPQHWLLSFCYGTVCNPFKVSFNLPAGGRKRVELLVAPLGATGGPWTMELAAGGQSTAIVQVRAKTAKAAITISAT
ncbi:MAG TPA: TlpA disulfide reductase family protein [Candidatus Eremiobacteraceae bacterium]|nr:TlpA disulfide reductase family protein [Candidatus Eremiobacteraceae bacterium]